VLSCVSFLITTLNAAVTDHAHWGVSTKTDVTSAILSHECATLSRGADAATVELHAAKTNTASAPVLPFYDPPSQTQFQNGEIVYI